MIDRKKTYLSLAVFGCLMCLPLGIFSVVYSRYAAKSEDAAEYESNLKKARNFAIAAIVFGVCWVLAELSGY